MTRLLVATRNPHKTREFARILGSEFEITDLTDASHLPVVEETGRTFEENAALKAVAASREISGLVVADDSGLEVDVLNGAPGVYSARYAGEHATDAENVAKLLSDLANLAAGGANRGARFRCALAVGEEGRILELVEGMVRGAITTAPHGAEGFGYDPVFVPDGYTRTFAELGASVKDAISHRARAIAALRQRISRS